MGSCRDATRLLKGPKTRDTGGTDTQAVGENDPADEMKDVASEERAIETGRVR